MVYLKLYRTFPCKFYKADVAFLLLQSATFQQEQSHAGKLLGSRATALPEAAMPALPEQR